MIRSFKYIVKKFKKHNCCVVGVKGSGKDLVFGNVIARRKKDYISNIDYTKRKWFIPLNFDNLDLACVKWTDFVDNNVPCYEFPYPIESDVYISDVGVYLPAQYCNEINRKYPHIATYQALSRQVSHNRFHINTQSLNRCYDKIREQSDIYFLCVRCFYIPKVNIVIQHVYEYDKYQSCVDRVKPARVRTPLFNKDAQMQAEIYLDKFRNTYGKIKSHWFIYRNKSKHDTYYFEKLFKDGIKKDEK